MTPHQSAILATVRATLRGERRATRALWTQIHHLSPIARARMAAALLSEGGHPWHLVARRLQYQSADAMVDSVLRYPQLAVVARGSGVPPTSSGDHRPTVTPAVPSRATRRIP